MLLCDFKGRFYCLVFGLVLPNFLTAQTTIQVTEGFEKIELKNHINYYVDYSDNQSFEFVKEHFKGMEIKNTYPNFGDSSHPHWLRFQLRNTGKYPKKVSLITKGIDSLQTFVTVQEAITHIFPKNGSHIPIFQRERTSPFLVTTFVMKPQIVYSVWVKIRNVHYRLAASPFDLYQYEAGAKFLLVKHFLYSIFIGSMFLIFLLGLGLVYFFKERIYWYYLGCITCALAIMLLYNDFGYLVTDKLPGFILNKNIFGVLSASVPVFYLLFAEQFLEVNLKAKRTLILISRVMIVLQYILILGLIVAGQALFDYKFMFYPFMGGFSTMTLYHLVTRFNIPQAKLFLLATVPVTVTVILESSSDAHHIPVQDIHDYYYLTTLTELLILTVGIVYRFKSNEQEKYELEQQKYALENEVLTIEYSAKNEISSHIAEKLHDEVSADIVITKTKIASIQRDLAGQTNPEDWDFVYQRLNSAYNSLRDLSHQLEKTVTSQSLVALIMGRYHGESMIEISYDGLQPDTAIDGRKEVVLFSVVSEAITNAIKHAQSSKIIVQINYDPPFLTVIVEDNGIGFNVNTNSTSGIGLKNIKHKVENNLMGTLLVDSNKTGTTVIIKIPLGE